MKQGIINTFVWASIVPLLLITRLDAKDSRMPSGFEHFWVGMTFDQLKQAVPELKELFDELYLEIPSNPYFDRIEFEFKKGRVSQIGFLFYKGLILEDLHKRASGFIEGIIAKWGQPTEAFLCVRGELKSSEGTEHPAWRWSFPEYEIVAVFVTKYLPSREEEPAMGGFEVYFIQPGLSYADECYCQRVVKDAGKLTNILAALGRGKTEKGEIFK